MNDAQKTGRPHAAKPVVSILLSMVLLLFLVDAIVSLLDESLILFSGIHALSLIRASVFLLSIVPLILTYFALGVTPLIPKRFFLPLALFNPVAMLVLIPFSIYYYKSLPQIGWSISACQVVFGLCI